ncbi:MAG: hypothetical protein M0P69_01455 [Bacteroidales bacterium]|nr:hypothetical protein [Bacteroidales bacterium]
MVSSTTAAIIGATVIGAGLGVRAAASGAFGRKKKDSSSAPKMDMGTGALSEGEAQTAAKKRLFRAGVIATSPTGLGSGETLGTTKLR